MLYCIDPNADEPIMMLDKHIGFDSEDGMGIDGAAFAKELMQLDTLNKKRIVVKVNCPGGSVIDGMNIYNAILNTKTPVDTENIGIAASMGGVCWMAGRKRTMADYASLMVHNPSGSSDRATLDSMRDSLTTMLSAKSGISKEDVGYLMDRTSWLNSSECFAKGFCTDIAATSEANKKYMPSTGARAMWIAATDIVNNSFTQTDNMKKVTAKLKLVDGANEDAIVASIEGLENSVNTLKTEKEKAENDLKEANNKVTEAENKLATVEASLKLVTDKAKEDADAVLLEKSTAMVTAAAKIGKIKNEAAAIKSWADLAVKDFDGTKKIIDELPLNKVAAVVDIDKVEGADKYAGSAAAKMLEISNRTKIK